MYYHLHVYPGGSNKTDTTKITMVSATTTCLTTCTTHAEALASSGRVEIKSKTNTTSTSTSSGATCINRRGGPPTEINMVFEISTRNANPIADIKQVETGWRSSTTPRTTSEREEHIAGGSAAAKVSEIQHTVERSR